MHNLRLRSGKKKLSDLLSPRTSFDSEDEPVSEEETSNEAVDEVKFVFYSASETIQLGCVRFHTISAAPIQPVSVMNTNGSSSWDTNPTNLIDTDCSFYWKDNNYCSRGKSEIIFKFNERVSINNYELFTSPNTPEADPIKWRVYGRTSATASGTPSGWKLMDSRKNFSPPTEREETYGLIAFNYGKEETRSPIHAATNSVLHINPQKVRLYTSNEVSGLWTCERASFCLEYDTVHQKIAINHKYMATTILQQRMNEIDNMIAKKKNTRTFCTIIQIGISLAFSVPEHTVKYYCNPEDGMNYFNSIMKLFESFAWRQPYMSHAFEILVEQNRVSDLKDVIGRLSRVASGVPTIKIEAFHYLIHLALDKTVISEQQAATTLSKKFLCFLDDYKINAFRSAFIEPTTFYYYLTLQKEKIEQAEIHCTNLYSALLLSTLGIQIPIMPYFMDESSACPPFLRIKTKEIKEAFKLMVKSAHFSEPWHKISYCKSLCVTKIQELPMNITENLATAIEISNKAIDVSPENQAFRKEVSEYMNRFAKFFTKEYIYEKMYIVLSAECQDELLSFFRNLRAANAKLEKYKTPKEWLYTKRGFNVERAHVLFTYLGFVEE